MQTSCRIIIILISCFIIPNVSSQTVPPAGSLHQFDLQVTALCVPPNICVDYTHCLANGSLNTGGENILVSKTLHGNNQLPVNYQLLPNGSRAEICSTLQLCCASEDYDIPPVSNNTNVFNGCGIRNANGISFGHNTNVTSLSQYGEFPWTVALIRHNPKHDQRKLMCGGSLIHPKVVLTAAHCVSEYSRPLFQFKVRAGDWDTSSTAEEFPFQERDISEIIVHEHFHNPTFRFDVALLILTEPFIFNSNIQTICLPSPNANSDDQQQCYASGWGDTVFSNVALRTTIMKKVELSVVPRSKCQSLLRNTILGPYFRVHTTLMCAGGADQDTCSGDGGSPLVCPYRDGSNRYYQTAIVATGIGCNQINIPGLYADIPIHRNWIDDQMSRRSFSTEYYVKSNF